MFDVCDIHDGISARINKKTENRPLSVLRELYEETGLTAKLDISRFASISYPISGFARKEVVFYLGEVVGEPTVREGEIDKYQWVTAAELKDYLHPDAFEACKVLFNDIHNF